MKVDYWNHPMTDMRPVLSLVNPEGMDFLNALNNSKISYEIASNNFQKSIDAEREQNEANKMIFKKKGLEKAFDYDNVYHTYDVSFVTTDIHNFYILLIIYRKSSLS